MRKYGMWVLTLGLMAAAPSVTNAEGFLGLGARRGSAPPVARRTAARPAQQARPQAQQGPSYNQQVAERIARTLRDAKLNGYDVEIEYRDGVATLKGDIADPAQRARALTLVSQVPGVRQVSNQMRSRQAAAPAPGAAARRSPVQQVSAQRPTPAQAASNQQLADRLAKALGSAGLSGYDVQIRVENGLATLAGAVGSPQQVAQAAQVARSVNGINQVTNQLKASARPAPRQAPRGQVAPVSYQQPTPARMASLPVPAVPSAGMPMGGGGGYGMGAPGMESPVYDTPNVPDYAWPSYASYPNYAAVSYPTEYSPSAFPYIGPFYPYPQVPLGWRKAQLEWDDGYWNLNFNPRTERWFWFMNPKNWAGNKH